MFAGQRLSSIRYENILALGAQVIQYFLSQRPPLLDFLDGVFAYEAEVAEAIAFPLLKVQPDPLGTPIDLSENIPRLLVHVDKDLLY
jgi:hypothetical protein